MGIGLVEQLVSPPPVHNFTVEGYKAPGVPPSLTLGVAHLGGSEKVDQFFAGLVLLGHTLVRRPAPAQQPNNDRYGGVIRYGGANVTVSSLPEDRAGRYFYGLGRTEFNQFYTMAEAIGRVPLGADSGVLVASIDLLKSGVSGSLQFFTAAERSAESARPAFTRRVRGAGTLSIWR